MESNESALIELYSSQIAKLSGISVRKAKKTVKEAIDECKREMIEDGWKGDYTNMGDIVLELAKSGEQKWLEVITKAYEDGCTNEDIIEWWNLPSLNRRMVTWSENVFRMSTWIHLKEKGLSGEQAAIEIHKVFPKYRFSNTSRDKGDEDAYLCQEIRGRVDQYQSTHDAEIIKTQVKNYTSYNAWVREKIRQGEL